MTQENGVPLQEKIIRQVEYYFGDSNLARDNFLKDQLGKEDGWVEIKTLLTFNRLKALTEDQQAVAEALRKSTTGLLEVNESGDKIKRITPLPEFNEEYKTELKLRTVHLRGFPTESTLDQINQFCSQYGHVEQVQMRRLNDKKTFKGCIFAVFKTVDEAKKAVEGEEKFLDKHELQREDKQQYFKRKSERNIKKNKRLINLNNENEENKEEEEFKYEPGCVLKLSGVTENMSYFDIKQAFLKHVKVEYVELFKEKSEALVRFGSSADLKTALEKLQPATTEVKTEKSETEEQEEEAAKSEIKSVQISIGDQKLDTEVMTGDEEAEYWKMVSKIRAEFTKKSKSNFKNNKRNKRKQGFGGSQKKKLRAEE